MAALKKIDGGKTPFMCGRFYEFEGIADEKVIAKAKEMVLEDIIKAIRDVAETKPDEFFIVHKPEDNVSAFFLGNRTTVAAKFILPTVSNDDTEASNSND